MTDLETAARKFCDAVEFDMNGRDGRGGNGGLMSDTTLRACHEVQAILNAIATAHPDNLAVDQFAAVMKAKLAKKRAEGRGGWEDKEQCSRRYLSDLLWEHARKGDPVDVANLAMMLYQRGEAIARYKLWEKLRSEAKGYALKLLLAKNAVDRLSQAVIACDRFFAEAMPKMNVKNSFLDANAIDAWNKAEIALASLKNEASAENGNGTPIEAATLSKEGPWLWFAGTDGELYGTGPEASKDDIIALAKSERLGEFFEDGSWCLSFQIVEARQDDLRLSDWIGADRFLERAEEEVSDSDRICAEFDEGPFFECSPEQEKDLATRIQQACDQWQRDHNLVFTCNTFSDSRSHESIVCVIDEDRSTSTD